jgi:hypothetical protein
MLVRIHRGLSKIWKSSNIQPSLVVSTSLVGQNDVDKEVLVGVYNKVLMAYKENELNSLQKWTEPGLYRKMEADFKEVKRNGGVFQVDEGEMESLFGEFSLTVGVDIDRKLNFKKKTYSEIFTGVDIARQMGEAEENFEKLKNMMLYIHLDAPTNAIISFIMRCDKGVRVVENGKKSEIDYFWIKLECEVLRMRSQKESMLSGEFQALINMLGRNEIGSSRTDWVITDINNTLAGNPYITE